jgi:hypothetical protein
MLIGIWGIHIGNGTFGVLVCGTRDNAEGEVFKSFGGFRLKDRMCNKELDTVTVACGREGGFVIQSYRGLPRSLQAVS